MIGIVDYGSGNLGAIANIFKQLKVPHVVSGKAEELATAERYLLPGVGAFDATMTQLKHSGLREMLDEQVLVRRKKVMGICVGMQVLAESSEEGSLPGLGWIKGRVRRIDASKIESQLKLPHMGWNTIEPVTAHPLLADIDQATGFYFLHNYFFDAALGENVVATTDYGARLTCAVANGHIAGLQFHPEKSHTNGMTVFRNFANW